MQSPLWGPAVAPPSPWSANVAKKPHAVVHGQRNGLELVQQQKLVDNSALPSFSRAIREQYEVLNAVQASKFRSWDANKCHKLGVGGMLGPQPAMEPYQ